jgi:hypothetical protein
LLTQPGSMVGDSSTNRGFFLLGHAGHVTCNTTYHPIRSQNNAAIRLRYSSSVTSPRR